MLSSLCVFALAAVVFFVIGFAFAGISRRSGLRIHRPRETLELDRCRTFFLSRPAAKRIACFAGGASGNAERGPCGHHPTGQRRGPLALGRELALSTAVFAAWTYPLFAHWVWSGWLAQLGAMRARPRFHRRGRRRPIQAVGGITALAVTWILGPRRGKYTSRAECRMAIPGHNAVLVLLRMFSDLARMDRTRLRRRHPLRPRRGRPLRIDRSERHALRCFRPVGSRRHHQNPLRQARRLALRQWLGQWPGGQQRRLRRNASGRGHDRRINGRRHW